MPKTFEENISELEKLVRRLESDECSLEESVELYSKGLILSKECKDQLDNAKQKITELKNPSFEE